MVLCNTDSHNAFCEGSYILYGDRTVQGFVVQQFHRNRGLRPCMGLQNFLGLWVLRYCKMGVQVPICQSCWMLRWCICPYVQGWLLHQCMTNGPPTGKGVTLGGKLQNMLWDRVIRWCITNVWPTGKGVTVEDKLQSLLCCRVYVTVSPMYGQQAREPRWKKNYKICYRVGYYGGVSPMYGQQGRELRWKRNYKICYAVG